MAVMNKPDYKVFAGSAKAGEVIAFPNVDRGWGYTLDTTGGIPPMESMNGMAKRQDEWLLYLTQQGIPEWSNVVDYPVNSVTKQGSVIYIALRASKDKQPSTSQSDWKKFTDYLGVDNKIDKSAVKQSTGSSTTDVMSQKSVTDSLSTKQNAGNYSLRGESYIKSESDQKYQPKGNYQVSGYSYSKGESNDRYNLKNTADTSINGWWECGTTGIMHVWMTADSKTGGEVRTVKLPKPFPNKCLNVIISWSDVHVQSSKPCQIVSYDSVSIRYIADGPGRVSLSATGF